MPRYQSGSLSLPHPLGHRGLYDLASALPLYKVYHLGRQDTSAIEQDGEHSDQRVQHQVIGPLGETQLRRTQGRT